MNQEEVLGKGRDFVLNWEGFLGIGVLGILKELNLVWRE